MNSLSGVLRYTDLVPTFAMWYAELSFQKPIQNFFKVSIYLNWPLVLKQKYNCDEDLSRHNNKS